MPIKKPHILITNDDGVHATGIKYLFDAIADFADITVVAPASQQSAASLSITIREPLHIQRVHWPDAENVWSVSGTPADCVKLALSVILKSPPDFIVSGINAGSNAGRNILYSGTVAGIIEGVMHDISGAAFSSFDFEDTPFARDVPYIKEIVKYLLKSPLPKGSFFNVNFPSHTYSEIKGCKLVKQGKEYWAESPDKRSHPYGHAYYWMGSKLAQFDEDEDSDVVWLKQGYMTAVPIAISELTDYAQLKSRKESFESIFEKVDVYT